MNGHSSTGDAVDAPEFRRRIAGLSTGEFRRFVAALWEAMGWRTAIDGAVVVASGHERGAADEVLLVAPGLRAAAAPIDPRVDAVVGRHAAAVRTIRGVADGGVDALGPADLRVRFVYAVGENERSELRARFPALDRAPRPAGRVRFALGERAARAAALSKRLSRDAPGIAAVALALLVLALVVQSAGTDPARRSGPARTPSLATNGAPASGAAATVGSDEAGDRPDGTADGTVARTADPTDGGTGTATPAVPAVCPAPPAEAHPRSLRPRVLDGVRAAGLEGWSVAFETNITSYDPNDRRAHSVPEVEHVAVYTSPGGDRYRVTVARWQSLERAAAGRSDAGNADLLWGSYTATVRRLGRAGSDASAVAADARALLAAVATPDGVRLGADCVGTLGRVEPNPPIEGDASAA